MHYSSQETINLIVELRKQGKTYSEIQKITGCCPKTISKYCMEMGLSENPKKVELTTDLLEEIQSRYNEVGNIKKVSEEYHIAVTTLRKNGIQVKNGKTQEEIVTQASCAQKAKLKAIFYKGGKCQLCGYNKSIRALQFHHLNPEEKDFTISGGTKSFEKMKPELDKCILVCSNCHAEIHDGITQIPENIEMIHNENFPIELQESKNSLVTPNAYNYKHFCKKCGKPITNYTTGKIYCSEECKWNDKGYPSIEEVNEQYEILKSWEKVAQHFNITRKIVNGIRKRGK